MMFYYGGIPMLKKIILDEEDMPRRWYNILPDLPEPLAPPLNPVTKEPLKPSDLEPIFPKSIIQQEMSPERWIDIPEEVLDILKIWRPSPLYRAYHLEKELKTPAEIYFKWEGTSPPGSHKPNTAIAQAYFNMKEGVERLTTETGAGQWGSALSFATQLFNLDLTVYMVKVSYNQKPYRRSLIEIWGAEVFPSPTNRTKSGRSILEKDPDSPGSLGIAISEAIEDAVSNDNTKYSLGSVLNHVLMHQTVIGLETMEQLKSVDREADTLIGCVGGGSNFGGFVTPFMRDKIKGDRKDLRAIAVEPMSCPTFTKGLYAYDYGDTAGLTPLLLMHTLGHNFIPAPIHAGGLRYHGNSPILSQLVHKKLVEARAYHQKEVFEAAMLFARTEGFVVAPETSHAVKAAIDEALEAKKTGEKKVIVFNASGHGHFDLSSYDAYLQGKLQNYEYPDELINKIKEEVIQP